MLTTPAASIGQSSFNGTWKVDFNSAMPKKVNAWLLQNGTYKCTSCSPIVDVRADGKDLETIGSATFPRTQLTVHCLWTCPM